jgi:hypothetical protein
VTPRAWIGCILLPGVVLAAACRRAGPEGPDRVVTRLAAHRYQTPGDPSTAAVPSATVGGERRPVLSRTQRVQLYQAVIPTGTRRMTLRVPIAEYLRGLRARLRHLRRE